MGRLTEDMTRLVAEINTGRSERGQLIRDMRHSTGEMKRAVAHQMRDFHAAHTQMARQQRQSLRGFVSGLHNTVVGLRTAFANDLAGARAAFFGAGAAPSGRAHSRRARSFSSEAA